MIRTLKPEDYAKGPKRIQLIGSPYRFKKKTMSEKIKQFLNKLYSIKQKDKPDNFEDQEKFADDVAQELTDNLNRQVLRKHPDDPRGN